MNKNFLIKSVLLFLISLFILSCQSFNHNEIIDDRDELIANEIVVGKIKLSNKLTDLRSNSGNLTHQFTFEDPEGNLGLSVGITNPNLNEVGCDYNNDGIVDFYMNFTDDGLIIYKDSKHVTINKSRIVKSDSEPNRYLLVPEKVYANSSSMRGWFGGKESFTHCFERRMGSTLGISMVLIAGSISGVGALGVGIGGALSCVLWTPQ